MSFRPGTIRSPSAAECIAPAGAAGLSRIELDPQRDRHARAALEAYADSAAAEMPWLAESLDERLRDAAQHDGSGFTYCNATVERVLDLAQAWAASQPDYTAAAWERVRAQLARMLTQPAPRQPALRRRAATGDLAEPVAGMAGAD
ncbi:peptidase [Burkholderia sp. Bp9017]|uniref:Peptidase n=1 Tax=Burkholderia anthina TaxID=179879 RepID=A0A7T6VHC5_9BURK|nr:MULTISPECIES: peptidase [Burkholderia]QQK03954.1 peptidase [Burkholderia anthina]RQZ23828.1 peptidase [Burkholderia sp. Bp9017]RQZ37248.1 peptidase [Burkholderia sp. Bp9016]